MLEPNTNKEEKSLKKELANILEDILPSDWGKPYIEYLLFGRVISDYLTGEEEERIANKNQFSALQIEN